MDEQVPRSARMRWSGVPVSGLPAILSNPNTDSQLIITAK
jgi:hypothetical protein